MAYPPPPPPELYLRGLISSIEVTTDLDTLVDLGDLLTNLATEAANQLSTHGSTASMLSGAQQVGG